MKVAVQSGMLPGKDLSEKFAFAKQCGFQGVEAIGRDFLRNIDAYEQAVEDTKLPISTICAGFGGCLLDPDPAVRQQAVTDMKALLQAAGKIGAVGLICAPIFGPPRLPDLMPLADAIQLEKDLLVEIIKQELAPVARQAGALLLIEPLNRYETHLLKTLGDGVEIVQRVGSPAVAVMADFFHMGIEETSTPEAIRRAADHIRHVHLADNTRAEPGSGDTNFLAGFAALKEIGFKGFMALECRLSGDRAETLRKTAAFVLDAMAKV